MTTALPTFIRQFAHVSGVTLLSVILMAFLTIPYSLGSHPGETRPGASLVERHLT